MKVDKIVVWSANNEEKPLLCTANSDYLIKNTADYRKKLLAFPKISEEKIHLCGQKKIDQSFLESIFYSAHEQYICYFATCAGKILMFSATFNQNEKEPDEKTLIEMMKKLHAATNNTTKTNSNLSFEEKIERTKKELYDTQNILKAALIKVEMRNEPIQSLAARAEGLDVKADDNLKKARRIQQKSYWRSGNVCPTFFNALFSTEFLADISELFGSCRRRRKR